MMSYINVTFAEIIDWKYQSKIRDHITMLTVQLDLLT